MGCPLEPPDPEVKNGAEMCEGLQLDRRGMWKVEEDSFTKTGMVLLGWRVGELSLWNQTGWGNWVQVHWQTFVCSMRWWRQMTDLSTFSCLCLAVTAGERSINTQEQSDGTQLSKLTEVMLLNNAFTGGGHFFMWSFLKHQKHAASEPKEIKLFF